MQLEEGVDDPIPVPGTNVSREPQHKKKKTTPNKADHLLDIVARKLDSPSTAYQNFGNYVAQTLEELGGNSSNTSAIAQKLISDVLFEAKVGTIDQHSKIVTPTQYACNPGHTPLLAPTPVHTPVPSPSPTEPLIECIPNYEVI